MQPAVQRRTETYYGGSMKVQMRSWQTGLLGVLAVSTLACGDPNLVEQRGYSKAPLERPARIGGAEQPGEMAQYGGPRRLQVARLELPEQSDVPAAPAQRAPVQLPEGVTEEMVAQGETLYGSTGNCFTCHAPNAVGTPLAPGINDTNWIHIDGSFEELVRIINDGVPQPAQYPAAMPARGGAALSEEQVRQIAAYVYSISRQ
jgi:mono/diheme cytochrome c family protein